MTFQQEGLLRRDGKRVLGEFLGSIVRLFPPELAHDIGIAILRHRLARYLPPPPSYRKGLDLSCTIPGIGELRHPIGLAAGFDKNARALPGFCDLGLSFLETGTVTPLAQPGNPKPRLFRLKSEMSIINRMGFNNDGHRAIFDRLEALALPCPVGVNLGKNKNTPQDQAISDFLKGIIKFRALNNYLVINLSSPNTAGLRDLATPTFISDLASEVRMHFDDTLPRIWIKLDPDRPKQEFQQIVESIMNEKFGGIILTNTHRVEWPETGGMSGHVLSHLSSQRLEWAWEVHQGKLPMIGCGGILSGIDVFHKLARGANAVQIYTALIYRGPWTVIHMLDELEAEMALNGFRSVSDVVGSYYK